MEEINLFSENKSHLKQLGEQLLLASDEAKQTQVHGSLLEVNQRWHNLFHHIEARWESSHSSLGSIYCVFVFQLSPLQKTRKDRTDSDFRAPKARGLLD